MTARPARLRGSKGCRPWVRHLPGALLLGALMLAGGCASRGRIERPSDGPLEISRAALDAVPDAIPRHEPVLPQTTRPYEAFGRRYEPMMTRAPYRTIGVASWYGRRYHGQKTASGEPYDMFAMTAAHPILPIPSYARVTALRSGRSVVVRINDRGPFVNDRLIDLSYVAAYRIGLIESGTGEVEVELLLPPVSERWWR